MGRNMLQELQDHRGKVDLGSNGARVAQHTGRPPDLCGSPEWSNWSMGLATENPQSRCRSLTGQCC